MSASTILIGCIILFILFQLKHWIIDFALQQKDSHLTKNQWNSPTSIVHSARHGMGTLVAVTLVFPAYGLLNLLLATVDAILHHCIDWGSAKRENSIGKTSYENTHFMQGSDQFLHQMCYVGYSVLILYHFGLL
jgi:hypothetical protein